MKLTPTELPGVVVVEPQVFAEVGHPLLILR